MRSPSRAAAEVSTGVERSTMWALERRASDPPRAVAAPTTRPATAERASPRPSSSAPSPAARPTRSPTSSQVRLIREPPPVAAGGVHPAGMACRGAIEPGVATAARSARASAWFCAAVAATDRPAARSRSAVSRSTRKWPETAPSVSTESSTPAARALSQPGPSRRRASVTAAERSARSRSRSASRIRSVRASARPPSRASAAGRTARSAASTAADSCSAIVRSRSMASSERRSASLARSRSTRASRSSRSAG